MLAIVPVRGAIPFHLPVSTRVAPGSSPGAGHALTSKPEVCDREFSSCRTVIWSDRVASSAALLRTLSRKLPPAKLRGGKQPQGFFHVPHSCHVPHPWVSAACSVVSSSYSLPLTCP